MSCIKFANVTGSADPANSAEAKWPADATAVTVVNDILDNIDVIAPGASDGVANGQQVVVICPIGGNIHGVIPNDVLAVPSGDSVHLVWFSGSWYVVS